jgi:hypothetical protein
MWDAVGCVGSSWVCAQVVGAVVVVVVAVTRSGWLRSGFAKGRE